MNIQRALLRLRGGVSSLTFLERRGGETVVGCGALFEEALSVCGALARCGVKRGDELLLQFDGVKNRVLALWACWLGGFIPVSSAVFSRADDLGKLKALSARHGGARAITDLEAWRGESLALDIDALPRSLAGEIVPMLDGDIALEQYTSGTTSGARCAVLTGSNLYESGVASGVVVRRGVRERYFNFLPLNHIFGLAAQHLVPLVNDFDQYHMSAARFLDEPALWARAITRFRATITGAAPFALELLRRDKELFGDADLSSVNVMFVGGGDLRAEPLWDFVADMQPFGWRRGVLLPAYGLTEASMGVCYTPPGEDITVYHIDPESARVGERLRFLGGGDPLDGALERVSLGVLDDCNEVEIRGENGGALGEERLGVVFVRGTNVMRGYYSRNENEPPNPDADGWLDTGDLGFFRNGRLALFARKKDVIIHNGVNYARDDLERIASLAAGGAAVLIEARGELALFARRLSRAELSAAARALGAARSLPITACGSLEEIPQTPKGAPDRVALAVAWESGEYDSLLFAPDLSGTPPHDSDMQPLATLWARALASPRRNFAPEADFFALGGDSLKLIDLACALEDETGVWFEPFELARRSTLREMADYIARGGLDAPM